MYLHMHMQLCQFVQHLGVVLTQPLDCLSVCLSVCKNVSAATRQILTNYDTDVEPLHGNRKHFPFDKMQSVRQRRKDSEFLM